MPPHSPIAVPSSSPTSGPASSPADPTAGGAYALVLAAGAGTRFGGAKLLAPLNGRPLVAYAATTVAEATARGILAGGVAVIPAGDTALASQFDMAGLGLVENRAAASGVGSSVRAGLAALEAMQDPPAGAALIVLADQPLLRVEVIARLVAEWREHGRSVRPRYARGPGGPGHPVLVDRSRWALAAGLTGDRGLGPLLETGPDAVTVIVVAGMNPDVDTTADLSSLMEGTARKLTEQFWTKFGASIAAAGPVTPASEPPAPEAPPAAAPPATPEAAAPEPPPPPTTPA